MSGRSTVGFWWPVSGFWFQLPAALAAAVFLALIGANVNAATAIAKIAYVEGQMEIIRYGHRVPEPAEVGMSIWPGDEIRAGGLRPGERKAGVRST